MYFFIQEVFDVFSPFSFKFKKGKFKENTNVTTGGGGEGGESRVTTCDIGVKNYEMCVM